jgi:hypothetical protein
VGHLSPYNNNGPQRKRLDSASVTGCFVYFRWSTMIPKWVTLSPVGPAFSFSFSFSFYFSTFLKFIFFLHLVQIEHVQLQEEVESSGTRR